MQGQTNESVGVSFREDLLQAARDKTLALIEDTAPKIQPGMTEQEARVLVAETQTKMGAPKSWHAPQIRFGQNTLLPFGKKGIADNKLNPNDIFFLDLGPIFEGHEGDVGRTFFLGDDPEMRRCCEDVAKIWHEVRQKWLKEKTRGAKLYEFAKERASTRDWILTLESANGHRISDFPHAARMRGAVETFEHELAPNRWILEIQIRHPTRPFGAFHEDLLN